MNETKRQAWGWRGRSENIALNVVQALRVANCDRSANSRPATTDSGNTVMAVMIMIVV